MLSLTLACALVNEPPGMAAGPGAQRDATGWATASRRASTRPRSTISWATRTALTMARAEDDPWLMMHTPSTPRSMAPPGPAGARWFGEGGRAGRRDLGADLAP